MTRQFPDGFLWGAAGGGYAAEGAVAVDGRTPGIWDRFSHTPGRTAEGGTGDIAADHYQRWRADVALLAELGVGAYRCAVAWPRIQPEGRGPANRAGLDFYDRLVDGLMAAGIAPWLCLHHWDLPQALQERGGWTRRDSAGRFADYAAIVARRLGDRARHVVAFARPAELALRGHAIGDHAPGLRDRAATLRAIHHLNLARATAAVALRAEDPGIALGHAADLRWIEPASRTAGDREAAEILAVLVSPAFADPVWLGRYPEPLDRWMAEVVPPETLAADAAAIARKPDFLAVTCAPPLRARRDPEAPFDLAPVFDIEPEPPPEAIAEALSEGLRALADRYGRPQIYVTTLNALLEEPAPIGREPDHGRAALLTAQLEAIGRVLAGGVDIRGHFAEPLLDGFEWNHGYARRPGLVGVDFATQTRIPRQSFAVYREIVRSGTFDPERYRGPRSRRT